MEARKIDAFRCLDRPIGKTLLRPDYTLHVWRNTTPCNIWIENARGRMMFHSKEGFECLLREAYRTLVPFLLLMSKGADGEAFTLQPSFAAEYAQWKIEQKTAPPSSNARRGYRL